MTAHVLFGILGWIRGTWNMVSMFDAGLAKLWQWNFGNDYSENFIVRLILCIVVPQGWLDCLHAGLKRVRHVRLPRIDWAGKGVCTAISRFSEEVALWFAQLRNQRYEFLRIQECVDQDSHVSTNLYFLFFFLLVTAEGAGCLVLAHLQVGEHKFSIWDVVGLNSGFWYHWVILLFIVELTNTRGPAEFVLRRKVIVGCLVEVGIQMLVYRPLLDGSIVFLVVEARVGRQIELGGRGDARRVHVLRYR